MTHQLIPNTYTICESTEQCKELFKIADNLGLINSGAFYINGEDMLYVDKDGLLYSCCEAHYLDPANKPKQTLNRIPLPEFISRLKGEWAEGISVKLPAKTWDALMPILNAYAPQHADIIEQQLNQHQ